MLNLPRVLSSLYFNCCFPFLVVSFFIISLSIPDTNICLSFKEDCRNIPIFQAIITLFSSSIYSCLILSLFFILLCLVNAFLFFVESLNRESEWVPFCQFYLLTFCHNHIIEIHFLSLEKSKYSFDSLWPGIELTITKVMSFIHWEILLDFLIDNHLHQAFF